jgi:hypothetical protein
MTKRAIDLLLDAVVIVLYVSPCRTAIFYTPRVNDLVPFLSEFPARFDVLP